ncbi:hypothetical protein EVAR_83003_1 [Eumeta japonica]|uniref:Uncharacterized protein n=1 Tax=Eumeta variegata TaxID=151549 RepID=A0A4C1VQU1_EUMVA|nr:hypothetical protein EVAR_83003_1 [Eumeta japonica]
MLNDLIRESGKVGLEMITLKTKAMTNDRQEAMLIDNNPIEYANLTDDLRKKHPSTAMTEGNISAVRLMIEIDKRVTHQEIWTSDFTDTEEAVTAYEKAVKATPKGGLAKCFLQWLHRMY